MSANIKKWRILMEIGMRFHRLAPPRPQKPSFRITIQAKLAARKGTFDLVFYAPPDYKRGEGTRPVVVNFHGGGFTIGRATDDARWCAAVASRVDALVCSVDYRLAPENPFPTPIEDGADAILYLVEHAAELGIDPARIAVTGFSAGGNMAFTVPLRFHEELQRRHEARAPHEQGRVAAVCAWYPSTDFTRSREERRATNPKPEKDKSGPLTRMFDASYLYTSPPSAEGSPWLSPGVAASERLRAALPDDILLYTCEWDELRDEAEEFRDRLQGELGKRVHYKLIESAGHSFDKTPNPFKFPKWMDELYAEACEELRKVLYGKEPEEQPA